MCEIYIWLCCIVVGVFLFLFFCFSFPQNVSLSRAVLQESKNVSFCHGDFYFLHAFQSIPSPATSLWPVLTEAPAVKH